MLTAKKILYSKPCNQNLANSRRGQKTPSHAEQSYYLKDLFKQGRGNCGMIEKDEGRVNAITLLMAERILPRP